MDILITGGTGFIGSSLCSALLQDGHSLHLLTRSPEQYINSEQQHYISALDQLDDDLVIDAVINLAGEPLNSGRWTEQLKQQFIDSRVQTTQALVSWMQSQPVPPVVMISGSAIGWYGHQEDKPLTETDTFAPGFSHDLCEAWEQAAEAASALSVRVCQLRIGIVLEADGGPLKEMLPPFKLGLGGPMGSGNQFWSWIHRDDLVRAIQYCLHDTVLSGPINATAPNPLRQKDFAKQLGQALNRPAIMPMPGWVAGLALGEFATEVLLQGQCVQPQKLLDVGFEFHYPTLDLALQAMPL